MLSLDDKMVVGRECGHSSVGTRLLWHRRGPGSDSQHGTTKACSCMIVIQALGRWKQENQQYKEGFHSVGSLRPVSAT